MQVYLARWQETDVAVKVIAQLQNLSPMQGLHPQDPCTMGAPSGAKSSLDLIDDQVLSDAPGGECFCVCVGTAKLPWIS